MFRYLSTLLLCPVFSVAAPFPIFDSVDPELVGEAMLSVYYSPPWGSYYVSAQTISSAVPTEIGSIEVPAQWDGELGYYEFVLAVHSSMTHFASIPLVGDVGTRSLENPQELPFGESDTLSLLRWEFQEITLPPQEVVLSLYAIPLHQPLQFQGVESLMEDLPAAAYTTTSGLTGRWKSYADEPGFSTGTWAVTVYSHTVPEPSGLMLAAIPFLRLLHRRGGRA